MTPEQLAAIRARAEAATPGPWHAQRWHIWGRYCREEGRPAIRGHDWEGFVAEILRYGLCCPDVRRVGEAVQQLRLDLGDGA